MADDKRAASASSASSSAPPSPQTPPPAAGAHSAADAAPLAGARQGRVLPDFRTTATLIGPPCGGRSTVFRRLMAELQQASDVSESEAGAVGLLRVDYDGRRALIKLSDASSDSLENFLCEGREHRNPFRACVFVLVASLRCDGLMDAPVCSDGAAEAASAPPKAAAQEEEEEEGPQSLPPASAVAASEAERQLLLSLDEWHARASKHCATPRPSFLVVATAMDLPASKRLSPAPVAAWAKGKGALFASTGLNFAHGLLQQPFSRAVAAALDLHTYPVMRRGYLVKQGAWMRNWKRRLFVLEREGRLRYYAEDRDEAKGTIDVTAARRLIPAEGADGDGTTGRGGGGGARAPDMASRRCYVCPQVIITHDPPLSCFTTTSIPFPPHRVQHKLAAKGRHGRVLWH